MFRVLAENKYGNGDALESDNIFTLKSDQVTTELKTTNLDKKLQIEETGWQLV